MTDKRILELYMAGDEAAIAETRERYGRYCRYIAEHIVGDPWIAEEIENDVLLKAWNTIPAEKPASLRSYLGMLSRQLAINRQAAESSKGRGGGEYAASLDELEECLPDVRTEGLADQLSLRNAMLNFLGSLPKKQRRIFLKRYWSAMSVREIAEDLRMSEDAVRKSLSRSREKLKNHLEREGLWE